MVSVPDSERCKFCGEPVRSGEARFNKKPGRQGRPRSVSGSVSSNEAIVHLGLHLVGVSCSAATWRGHPKRSAVPVRSVLRIATQYLAGSGPRAPPVSAIQLQYCRENQSGESNRLQRAGLKRPKRAALRGDMRPLSQELPLRPTILQP